MKETLALKYRLESSRRKLLRNIELLSSSSSSLSLPLSTTVLSVLSFTRSVKQVCTRVVLVLIFRPLDSRIQFNKLESRVGTRVPSKIGYTELCQRHETGSRQGSLSRYSSRCVTRVEKCLLLPIVHGYSDSVCCCRVCCCWCFLWSLLLLLL